MFQRLPVARQELDGLGATHARSSLATLAGNLEQAPRLVEAARGFVTTGEQHLQADDRPSAVAAARAAEDALGQAAILLLIGGGLGTLIASSRVARIAPVSREMILNFVAQTSLGLPKSY